MEVPTAAPAVGLLADADLNGDLFFLRNSLEHGMSFAEVAGFLRRTEDEVRETDQRQRSREH
jgi:hypothetical protein